MTKRILIACMAAIGIAAGAGCTTLIKYDLANLSTARPDSKSQAMRVAVAPLQDMRSAEEKDPQNITYLETRDRIFE